MSSTRVRWLVVLGLGLAGVLGLVIHLRGRSPGPATASRDEAPGRLRRVRPARAPAVLPGRLDRDPLSGKALVDQVLAPPPGTAGTGDADAGAARADPIAPPADRFTLHPRMQERLSAMGRSERRIWTERLLGNLRNRVKEVEGRIARHEAAGNVRAAHGERITRGRITDGIGALERQLARLNGPPPAAGAARDAAPPP